MTENIPKGDPKNPNATRARPNSPERSHKIPYVILGGVVAIVAGIVLMVWHAESKVNKVALAATAKPVTVVAAKAASFRASRVYVGTLQPWVEARVGPQFVTAYVDTVLVRPGAAVKRNDVLATLDCRNASAASQAVAMQARAIDEEQKAVAHEARRMQGLYDLDAGFIDPNTVERRNAESTAKAAQLLSEKAKMMNAVLEVNDCVLRAPFDGEIATRSEDPGAFVRPGTQIVSVIDRSIVRVTGDAPEGDFEVVSPGTIATIHALSTGKDLKATISRRAPAADPGTRTIHFEIDVPDVDRLLPVGTTAEIRIEVGEPVPTTELPLYAASIRGAKAMLFVIDGDVAHSRTVAVKGEIGGSIFLDRELRPGSRVVTEGRALLEDGDRVSAKDAVELSSAAPTSSQTESSKP